MTSLQCESEGPSTYSKVPRLMPTGRLGQTPSPLLLNVHLEFHTPCFSRADEFRFVKSSERVPSVPLL